MTLNVNVRRLATERSFNSLAGVAPNTRDRVVCTALRLLAQKGYSSTSVADILRPADVNAPSINARSGSQPSRR
jgi:AcrR family transcriptional regulator